MVAQYGLNGWEDHTRGVEALYGLHGWEDHTRGVEALYGLHGWESIMGLWGRIMESMGGKYIMGV